MTFTISKEFHFAASHRLAGLADDHPCGRLHGHNYVVRVEITSTEVNEVGFVLDYRSLDPIKAWIDDTLDHRDLNTALPTLANPTAELLAQHLGRWIIPNLLHLPRPVLIAVSVSETPKTWATWKAP